MKANKVSLIKKIKESKIDFVSLSKYFLVTIGLLLIAGIILISTIGFNLGFEYAGGTVIEVIYDVDADGTIYHEEQIKDVIAISIADYGLKVASIQNEESSFGDRIVYKTTSKTTLQDKDVEKINESIYSMLGAYDKEDIIQSQYVKVYNVQGAVSDKITYASIALAVAIALIFLGVFIRYGLGQAISTCIILVLNILTVIAFVAISRVPLNTAFLASVFTTFFLTLIGELVVFDRIRTNIKNNEYKNFNRADHINLAIKESMTILTLLLSLSLIAMILVSGLGIVSIRSFGIPALFGGVLAQLSVVFGLPLLYASIILKR